MKKNVKLLTMLASILMLVACKCPICDNKCVWEDVFDKNLTNAEYEQGVWSYNDEGVLVSNKDSSIFSKKDYENFELKFEFKMDEKANSGVIIYCSDLKDWIPNSLEIQVADSNHFKTRAFYQCGSVYGHVAPKYFTGGLVGDWHTMLIRCVGKNIDVYIDDKPTCSMNMAEFTDAKKTPNGEDIPSWLVKHKKCDLPTKGRIAFQGKHGNAMVYFRNIKIRSVK